MSHGLLLASESEVWVILNTFLLDELSINMGEIVSIKDVSADGRTTVQVTYDLINKDNIDIIYGMHPAISYRDLGSDKVYHKKVNRIKMLQKCYKNVTKMLQKMLQKCYKNVTKMLQKMIQKWYRNVKKLLLTMLQIEINTAFRLKQPIILFG